MADVPLNRGITVPTMKVDRVYLLHIEEAIANIQDYVSEGKDAFFSKRMIQDAVTN